MKPIKIMTTKHGLHAPGEIIEGYIIVTDVDKSRVLVYLPKSEKSFCGSLEISKPLSDSDTYITCSDDAYVNLSEQENEIFKKLVGLNA